MKHRLPSKWAKVDRFQGLLHLRILRKSNFENFEFSSVTFKNVFLHLKKMFGLSKFEVDKTLHSATNGKFKLVVYQSAC